MLSDSELHQNSKDIQKILEWENGYIAVTAKYKGLPEEEEYIDLVPILENLYIDPDEFLKQIEKVRISYD